MRHGTDRLLVCVAEIRRKAGYHDDGKSLGCGVPVGAFLMTEKVGQHSLTAGDHGTTYGGNPLACAAVAKVLELFEENNILEHVREVSAYLEEKLDSLAAKYDLSRTEEAWD